MFSRKAGTGTLLPRFFLSSISLFFLTLAISVSADSIGTNSYVFNNQTASADVSVNDFQLTPTQIALGSSTDLSVSLKNTGGAAGIASMTVRIYDSNNAQVGTITFSDTTILPGSTVIITKTWSTSPLPSGSYSAVVSGTFNGGQSNTNSVTVKFSIFQIVNPSQLNESNGITGIASNAFSGFPSPLPKEIIPIEGPIKFLKTEVATEILAGEDSITNLLLQNSLNRSVTAKVDVYGLPEGWITLNPATTILLPGEQRNVDLALSVPKDTLPGDYLGKLHLNVEGREEFEFIVIRVKNVPERGGVVALKTINLDRVSKTTIVNIRVINEFGKDLSLVKITERIPSGTNVSKDSISFIEKTGTITSLSPLVIQWEFLNMKAKEANSLIYSLNFLANDYSKYAYWPVQEVYSSAGTSVGLLRIISVKSPIFSKGEVKQVVASVIYLGVKPVETQAFFQTTPDFDVQPPVNKVVLVPGVEQTVQFQVRNKNDFYGTSVGSLTLIAGDESVTENVDLVAVPAQSNLLSMGGWFIALVAASALLFLYLMRLRGTDVHVALEREARDLYLQQLKNIVKK